MLSVACSKANGDEQDKNSPFWWNKLIPAPSRNAHHAPRPHRRRCYTYIEHAWLAQRREVGCTLLRAFQHPSQSPLAIESSRRATRHVPTSPSTFRLIMYHVTTHRWKHHHNPNAAGTETYQTLHPALCEPSSGLQDYVQVSTGPSS